jgi:hypothetical protein
VDLTAVDRVVTGLGEMAALDGWRLVVALADRHGVARWRAEAERRAVGLLADAGRQEDALRAEVARTLG